MQGKGFKLVKMPNSFAHGIDDVESLPNFRIYVRYLAVNELKHIWNQQLLMRSRMDCNLKIYNTILSALRREYDANMLQFKLEEEAFNICSKVLQEAWLALEARGHSCQGMHSVK